VTGGTAHRCRDVRGAAPGAEPPSDRFGGCGIPFPHGRRTDPPRGAVRAYSSGTRGPPTIVPGPETISYQGNAPWVPKKRAKTAAGFDSVTHDLLAGVATVVRSLQPVRAAIAPLSLANPRRRHTVHPETAGYRPAG